MMQSSGEGSPLTPKQSLTRKQSLIRRSLAVLSAALLVAAWTIGISTPASAAVKGFLQIVSITDQQSGFGGTVPNETRPLDHDVVGPVQNRSFNVAVRVIDRAPGEPNPQPVTVSKATTIVLEASGPGELGGTTEAVIPRNGSEAIISGATYSELANGVTLSVLVDSGVDLAPDEVTVEVALKAVGRNAEPTVPVEVIDPECAAPTSGVPNCGQFLLPNGANGHVTVSVGSCDGLDEDPVIPIPPEIECRAGALVVTAIANLKDEDGEPLYTKNSPATLVWACDKDLCRETANGVPKLPLFFTLDNTGPLEQVAGACPAKGMIGATQDACVDYASSSRNRGDLYLHLLFVADARCIG
jgi:hypothetical protein